MEDFAMNFDDQMFEENTDDMFDNLEDINMEDWQDELNAIEKFDLDIDEEI
ncbi:hypothetical protein [Flammeovirga pacifica]|uniref:hypothetical protein n=1 Tax=Flammeovirga pacifica TaxID=915059 RepID=UPI0013012A80|nr:hypothetical protein [Flammeovirga pacifica]